MFEHDRIVIDLEDRISDTDTETGFIIQDIAIRCRRRIQDAEDREIFGILNATSGH